MSEYYKSLITDEEVIRELLKESKRREGRLPTEATRIKPNLNFFQRTVSSLVSNNTRIDKSQDSFKTDYLKDCNTEKQEKPDDSPKTPPKKSSIDYAFERDMVLKTKINFLKASETFNGGLGGRFKKKIEIKKIQFVRALTNASNTANNKTNNKETDNKRNKQLSVAISNGSLNDTDNESNTSQSSSDLRLLSNDEARQTTCKSVSMKQHKAEVKYKSKTINKNDVILISSDEDKVKSSKLKDKQVKKTHIKKRKKELKDGSDEGSRKKRKRNKRKKEKLLKDK